MAVNGAGLRMFGRFLRNIGQSFDAVGRNLQGKEGFVERLVPSTRVVGFKGKSLQYGDEAFVATSASTIGDIKMGDMSSVWYGASLRGDGGRVFIGHGSSILDNAIVHGTQAAPVTLGNDVVISAGAIVRSATIGNGAMIGMGAVVLPGATIGSDSFVDAGAVVSAGAVVPPGELWSGRPARHLRTLSLDEIKYLRSMAIELAGLAQQHCDEGEKSVTDVEADYETKLHRQERGFPDDTAVRTTEPDVVEYYKLTAAGENAGLFRENEYDQAAEQAIKEAEEQAADAKENEHYYRLARLRRVVETLKTLSGTRTDRPEAKDQLLANLRSLDPKAEEVVVDFLSRAHRADVSEKAHLSKELEKYMLPLDAVDTLGKHGGAPNGQ